MGFKGMGREMESRVKLESLSILAVWAWVGPENHKEVCPAEDLADGRLPAGLP